MEKLVIEGGYPLSGTVVPAGNKNAALPILAACLLTEEELVIGNVPRIRDVDAMLALLEDLGVSVVWLEEHELSLRADSIRDATVDAELATRIRASFLLAGPLLARVGEAHMPSPGGDFIGRRRLDPHLDALRALGAEIEADRGYTMHAPDGLRACEFFMD
jgi:UDP-N-acetylglucosamine 1-carboxyvinyltransferase